MSRPNAVPLRAVKVQSFSESTPAALATAINAWITANARLRYMLALNFEVADTSSHIAYLTYTE